MYILKKSYNPHHISSHILWRRALQEQEANKPWQRLKQRLLLWLQLLAALLIVLALMEPVIQKLISKDEHVIIVIDRSASMDALTSSSGESYLQLAKEQANNWVKEQVAGSPITLIINGDYPQIVTSREQQVDKVINAINNIEPYYGVSDDETTMSLAKALATEENDTVINYYVDRSFKATNTAIGMEQESNKREYWNIIGNEESQRNVNIRSFTINAESKQSAEAFVTIAHPEDWNHSLHLTFTAFNENNKVIASTEKTVAASSGQYTTVSMKNLPISYYYKVEIDARSEERNVTDNMMYQVLAKDTGYHVLLVTEGNLFLEKALQLMNAELTKLAPSNEPPNSSKNTPYQFIIVDGSYDKLMNNPAWSAYFNKLPLWIIDHPQKDEATTVNPASQEVIIDQHLITQYITFDDTYISQLRKLNHDELSFGSTVIQYGGVPAIVAGYEQQKPKLRYTFALQDTDFPLRAEFPILIMQSLAYMVQGTAEQLGSYIVGSEPAITLSPNTASTYWQPLSENLAVESSEAISYEQALVTPSMPGVYQLVELNEQNEFLQARIAVIQTDPSEYAYSLNSELMKHSQEQAQLSGSSEAKGLQSVMPLLVILLMFCLVIEWEVYRRGL